MSQEHSGGRLTSARQGPMVIILTLLVTSFVVGVLINQVWHKVKVVELGYEMTRLTHERQKLMARQERLLLETSVQLRTERLDQVARKQGLVPVQPKQILRVGSSRPTARKN
jgi:cell division protein FtsL